MNYMGSKRRVCGWLVPFLQDEIDTRGIACYVEPFGGGANVIDKIKCDRKVYYDANPYLVALMEHIAETKGEDIPSTVTRDEYYEVKDNKDAYAPWYVGLVGFCSFGGKFFAGHAGEYKNGRSRVKEILNNLRKQAPNLSGIEFHCANYKDIIFPHNCLVYCDPPYLGTTSYKGCAYPFDHDEYYDWVCEISKEHTVYCSEKYMPKKFKVVKEDVIRNTVNAEDNISFQNEKLFTLLQD